MSTQNPLRQILPMSGKIFPFTRQEMPWHGKCCALFAVLFPSGADLAWLLLCLLASGNDPAIQTNQPTNQKPK